MLHSYLSVFGRSSVAKGLARGDVEQRLRAAAAQGQHLANAVQVGSLTCCN